ncbi:MAG TPA: hypothetical protein VK190_04535 [Pseudoneobacillus sp.]|nr:hypothetical protein [Pseudoneobacillus sp.]
MRLEVMDGKGKRYWGASKHAVEMFIDRDKFSTEDNWKGAMISLLKMMNKATFVCYEERDIMAEIYTYKNWIFVTKESTIVTVYEKKGSKYERKIS